MSFKGNTDPYDPLYAHYEWINGYETMIDIHSPNLVSRNRNRKKVHPITSNKHHQKSKLLKTHIS